MPRKARELSPLEVRRLLRPGRWSVGGVDGLALQVTTSGARSWSFVSACRANSAKWDWETFPRCPLLRRGKRLARIVQGWSRC